MRACEGCRRRKIKCDAATTNQWPCASCVRLKQHCVPPTVNYDRAQASSGSISGLERVLDFDNSSGSGDDEYSQPASAPQMFELQHSQGPMQGTYSAALGPFNTPPYTEKAFSQHEYAFDDMATMPLHVPAPSYSDHNIYNAPHNATITSSNEGNWHKEQYAAELSDVLGELNINENGVGTFEEPMDLNFVNLDDRR